MRRHDDIDPGHVSQDRFESLRVERPEPGSIPSARGHDDDRALPAAVRPPVHAPKLGDDLIERQGEEVGELDEGHGPSPGEARPIATPTMVDSESG